MNESEELKKSFELAAKQNEKFTELFQEVIESDDYTAVGIYLTIVKAEVDAFWKHLAGKLPRETMAAVEAVSKQFTEQIIGFIEQATNIEYN